MQIRFENLFDSSFPDSFRWQIALLEKSVFLALRHSTDVADHVGAKFVLGVDTTHRPFRFDPRQRLLRDPQ